MPGHHIIVIGASAGGIEALRELVGGLPGDLPAAVFVVVHQAPEGPGLLATVLSRSAALETSRAVDGEPIREGRIYVAPPDRHLVLSGGSVRLSRGPRENRSRPAIDPLFRSAAVHHGPRVIGVVLTGGLDDGTAGLSAIKRCGGRAVVQNPLGALYPSMPLSALRNVSVDHCVELGQIAPLLLRLVNEPPTSSSAVPARAEALRAEERIAEEEDVDEDTLDRLGTRAKLTCPDCGGALWELKDGEPLRYRCHTGHGYTADTLLAEISAGTEDALWAAVRSFDENAMMLERMAARARDQEQPVVESRFLRRAGQARLHAVEVRRLLDTMPAAVEPAAEEA